MIFCQNLSFLHLTKPDKSCIHPHSFSTNIMARISGVNIPTNKRVHVALTYILVLV